MLLFLWGCAETKPEDCEGEDPIALYGTQEWEGEPGVASLATWGGPGRICEATCDTDWMHPSLILGLEPCDGSRTELELQEGESGTLCVLVDQGHAGEGICTAELPSGPVDFFLSIRRG